MAPIIFKVSLNTVGFEQWLNQYLLPSLKIPSVLIMDYSRIHGKNVIRELVEAGGHQLLFLPKYSPALFYLWQKYYCFLGNKQQGTGNR